MEGRGENGLDFAATVTHSTANKQTLMMDIVTRRTLGSTFIRAFDVKVPSAHVVRVKMDMDMVDA